MTATNSNSGNLNTNVVESCTIKRFDTGVAASETSYTFPAGTKRFTLTNVGANTMQCSFTAGDTNTEYFELSPSASHFESNIGLNAGLSIYVRCPLANQTLEIISWS